MKINSNSGQLMDQVHSQIYPLQRNEQNEKSSSKKSQKTQSNNEKDDRCMKFDQKHANKRINENKHFLRLRSVFSTISLLIIIFQALISPISASVPISQKIYEHQLIEGIEQPHTSYKYFNFMVGMRYYSGTEHLVVKLIADSYQSDPDLFISKKNQFPQDSSNAEWTCQRKGGETCIIHNGEFEVGDTFYIGVKCQRECQYKLYTHFLNVQTVGNNLRTQLRFDQYSTNLIRYYIPSKVKVKTRTNKVIDAMLKVEPEDNQSYLEMYLSFDKYFNLLEEKPAVQVVDDGIAVKFSDKDITWCTKCWVYFVVNVHKNQRYYITTETNYQMVELTKLSSIEIVINPFQQQCFQYTVLRKKRDAIFWITEYSGHADTYIAAIDESKGPTDPLNLFKDAHGPVRQIVLQKEIRDWFGAMTGNYYICFYARTPFSGQVRGNEIDFQGTFEQNNNEMITSVIKANSFFKSKMTDSKLNQDCQIYIYLQAQQWKDQSKTPELYYKTCEFTNFDDCMLKDDEKNMIRVKLEEQDDGKYNGTIRHLPEYCKDPNSCTVFFKTVNTLQNSKDYKLFSLKADIEVYNPQDVDLQMEYVNVVQYGQFINYEINQISNKKIQPFISELTITVESMIGDADLFVSFVSANPSITNFEYQSRTEQYINQITLVEKEENWLNRPIFFSIFGNSKAEVRIKFSYKYRSSKNSYLGSSIRLGDNSHLHQTIETEKEDRIYTFKPWWTGREKRSMVFIADMIFNKVIFFAQWNEYPRHFRTSLHDENDLISIYPEDKYYEFTGGQYYIRLRPDFALYDLFTGRFYIYNMIAFTQAEFANENNREQKYEDLELGREYFGFIKSNQYQDYRYLQVDMEATYDIRLKRIPQRGNPKFYVKTIDEGLGWSARENNFHYQSMPDPEKPESRENLTYTPDQRYTRWPNCNFYQRSMQTDGSLKCFIAIGVTCEDNKGCAYILTIDTVHKKNDGWHDEDKNKDLKPPITLQTTDFLNSNVTKGQIKYFFLPFNATKTTEIVVLLNKTNIFSGNKNGNVKMVASFQSKIDNPFFSFYKLWHFPKENDNDLISNQGNNEQPELLQAKQELLLEKCRISACALIVGVIGTTDELSSFRIKAFKSDNKLEQLQPTNHSSFYEYLGDYIYDYYWFTIPKGLDRFNYQIAVATTGKTTEGFNNPDLYISISDGRYPTKDDYDLESSMQGADAIQLTSDLNIWKENNWDYKQGVVVVVSVLRTSTTVPYTLQLSSIGDYDVDIQRMKSGESVVIQQPSRHQAVKQRVFMFNNYENDDITVTLTSRQSNMTLYSQKTGQNDYQNNIFTAIPRNKFLSDKSVDVQQMTAGSISIQGKDCYQCWYFFVVEVDMPQRTQYRLTISRKLNQNQNIQRIPELNKDIPTQVYIASGYYNIRKFKLESMENWVIEVLVANGAVELYVGQDIQSLGPKNHIWSKSSQNGIARLEVQTTDINFHMSTYYFLQVNSVGGQDAIVSITLKQKKIVNFLTHNHDSTFVLTAPNFNKAILFQKFEYQTDQEIMKRHIFQVPGMQDNAMQFHRVKIIIEALTEHFYPMIFLNKYESSTQILDFSQLQYPDLNDYEISVGENPLKSLNKSVFEYNFEGGSANKFVYYTMVIYEHNWGLTDIRKSEYQIRIETERITSLTPKVQAIQMSKAAPYSPVEDLSFMQN